MRLIVYARGYAFRLRIPFACWRARFGRELPSRDRKEASRQYGFCIAIGLLLILNLTAAENAKLPEPYQNIVELSHSAPPEFGADALLRVVESGKIRGLDDRRNLVEQAFRQAGMAKFPVRMRGVPGTLMDTRSGFLSRAYDLKLDALSLQSRSVRDMLPIDASKARELFQQISRPQLDRLTCYDALVYDVADYYQALGAVMEGAFTAQERKQEEHLNFLLDKLGQVSSPSELAPLARVIKSVGVSVQQREILWNRFAGLLESLQPDDRSFLAAVDDIGREIDLAVAASFAKFRHNSAGCPDDARQGVTLELSQGPVHAGKTPTVEHYWESPAAKQLMQGAQKLRFTSDGKLIPDSARSTPEWQQQVTDYLSQLANWTAGQEKSEADYFHQKCIVYEALVELIPRGPQRDKTLAAYFDFIGSSNLQQQKPVEWFMHLHSMLDRVRNSNNGEPAKLLDAFERSGIPMLALYAAEEKAFGTQVPSWVTDSK